MISTCKRPTRCQVWTGGQWSFYQSSGSFASVVWTPAFSQGKHRGMMSKKISYAKRCVSHSVSKEYYQLHLGWVTMVSMVKRVIKNRTGSLKTTGEATIFHRFQAYPSLFSIFSDHVIQSILGCSSEKPISTSLLAEMPTLAGWKSIFLQSPCLGWFMPQF